MLLIVGIFLCLCSVKTTCLCVSRCVFVCAFFFWLGNGGCSRSAQPSKKTEWRARMCVCLLRGTESKQFSLPVCTQVAQQIFGKENKLLPQIKKELGSGGKRSRERCTLLSFTSLYIAIHGEEWSRVGGGWRRGWSRQDG